MGDDKRSLEDESDRKNQIKSNKITEERTTASSTDVEHNRREAHGLTAGSHVQHSRLYQYPHLNLIFS